MMMINSCINPIVYTTTIPAFKTLVKGLLRCDLAGKLGEMVETSQAGTIRKKSTKHNNMISALGGQTTSSSGLNVQKQESEIEAARKMKSNSRQQELTRQNKLQSSKSISITGVTYQP